jgi:signal transduction histidine kinase
MKDIIKQMERLKSVLVIPSISESEYFGEPMLLSMLCLNGKTNEEPFSLDDINFLESMADQATITIEYAIILKDLEGKREKLVESEKLASLGTMAAGVAHEIKNPLAALKLFTEVIPQKFDDPEYRAKFAQLIPSELARLRRILSDLEEFSKPTPATTAPFLVKEVMQKTLQLLEPQLKKSGVKVETELSDVPEISGSSSKMMQVFMNIILNAAHAMEGGGVLKVSCKCTVNSVQIIIADTGTGIPKDKIKAIFDPFFTTKETGTGLGLAITKRIVEEHKGTIEVESEVGKGTRFTLSFPVA